MYWQFASIGRNLVGALFGLVENVCQVAFAAVLTIEVVGHEDARAAAVIRALTSQASDFAVLVHLVVFQHGQLDLLLLVLDLFRCGVVLLLALAATTSETQDEMECGLLLDVVVGQGAAVLQLFASEYKTLLVWRDAFFILDFCFHILNSITCLDLREKN